MTTTALLLIDFQNDYFEGGKWQLEGTEQAAANGARLLKAFREAGKPVFHVRHEFTTSDAPFFAPGSAGADIHSLVTPLADEPVILKHHISAFRGTDLKAQLDQANIEHVVVVGAMSHMCIDAAVRAAADYGYEVSVAEDACATRAQSFNNVEVNARQVHAAYMAALDFAYATVTSTDELLSEVL